MSPRSLVFSSSEETSRQFSQALHDLDLQVESCREIFAALKSLTSRIFDVIVVDWDEGLEAGFLLKTARDLRTNHAAFTIVVGRAESEATLWQTGADLAITKPIFPNQVRYALLTCDKFLARMPAWLPQAEILRAKPRPLTGYEPVMETSIADRPSGPVAPATAELSFATLEGGLLRNLRSRFRSAWPTRQGSPGTLHHTFLSKAALVVAFFVVGYVFSQPLSKVGASAIHIYRHTVAGTQPQEQKSIQPASGLTESDPPEPSRQQRNTSARIHVISVRNSLESPKNSRSDSSKVVRTVSHHEPEPVARASRKAPIPESIRNPYPETATVRTAEGKLKPALLDAFEPVSVPGYAAEKMLLDKIAPSYPAEALQAGLQGPVVLQAWIGRDGKIRDLKLIRGPLLLGRAACQAVKQWRYKPYLLNGEAVDAQTYVTVDFKLP